MTENSPIKDGLTTGHGADLECLLGGEGIALECTPDAISILEKHGATQVEQDSVLIYGADFAEPILASGGDPEGRWMSCLASPSAQLAIVRLEGFLGNLPTPMSLVVDHEQRALCFSVPEGAIWGFATRQQVPRLSPLVSFAEICRSLISRFSPRVGYWGTEGLSAEDLWSADAEALGVSEIDDAFLSDSDIQDQLQWYKNVYLRRPQYRLE